MHAPRTSSKEPVSCTENLEQANDSLNKAVESEDMMAIKVAKEMVCAAKLSISS